MPYSHLRSHYSTTSNVDLRQKRRSQFRVLSEKTRSGKYSRNFFQCITPFNVLSRRIIVALDKLETNMPSCYYRVSVVYYWTFLPFVFVVVKNVPVLRRATAVGKKLGKSSYTMSTE